MWSKDFMSHLAENDLLSGSLVIWKTSTKLALYFSETLYMNFFVLKICHQFEGLYTITGLNWTTGLPPQLKESSAL